MKTTKTDAFWQTFCEPPYLVIRKGVSFWVENKRLIDWTATPQAFDEGCFRNACIYDSNGDLWQIAHAEFKQELSILNKALQWKQLPLQIDISTSPRPGIQDVLAELAAVLESGNEFSENLNRDPTAVLECLRRATTPTELIQYAGECV